LNRRKKIGIFGENFADPEVADLTPASKFFDPGPSLQHWLDPSKTPNSNAPVKKPFKNYQFLIF